MKFFQKSPFFWLSLLSGLLLSVAWPHIGSLSPLIFVALVPLLIIEDHVFQKKYRGRKVFFSAWLSFFVFNTCTTWWIWFSTDVGMALAIILNSLFMAIVFWFFHFTKKKVGKKEGYISLFIYWLCFEYLHYSWELSWPWLTFGNVFANDVEFIQWYEYSGTAGGTLWIILVNVLWFIIIRNIYWLKTETWKTQNRKTVFALSVILLPCIFGYVMYLNYEETSNPADIVLVQPNIDPYNEKFVNGTGDQQMEKFLSLAKQKMDDKVDFLVGPETQLPFSVLENFIDSVREIKQLRTFMQDYPGTRFITGMSSYRVFKKEETDSETARPVEGAEEYVYDSYNAAFQMVKNEPIQIYHKSKLVLAVEKVPFAGWFPFLEKLALDLGGTVGSLGVQEEPSVFTSDLNPQHVIAPAICYESIYGEYITKYVQKGATLIFIITNDGWWDNTPGHKQHMAYARIRAIENRRSIARCANTGVSCFINQRGDVIEKTTWWEPAVIRQTINANDELTLYSKTGDIIGRTAGFVSILLVMLTFAKALMRKKPGEL
ncbi:MAG: apolipoprotein N-acyltransferase [Bacteroidota bacterium]